MNGSSLPQSINLRPVDMASPRAEFLLEMYRQTSNHLNRHVVLLWQSVALLGGAYAAFAFQEKNVISIHHATAIALLLCGWFCANVFDAYAWFDRNLVIIANIERLFLEQQDISLVHPFFMKHRDANDMVQHFRIQLFLGLMIAAIVSGVHFYKQVVPTFKIPNGVFDAELALPYAVFVISLGYCMHIRRKVLSKAADLRKSSPGLTT
ncbi:hypothetical protein AB4Z46_33065 [Variovorax sp. M-6]|uniref:hypothetical protein n=1 Tax=Variovorax sp. M-6 TaxID=3233041 RepID=UPI003F975A95